MVLERAPNETFGLTVSGVADHRKLAIGQHGVIVTGIKGNTPSSEQQLLEYGGLWLFYGVFHVCSYSTVS